MPMAKNLVELRDVYKIYGEGLESEVRALDGVSLTIGKGEFVAGGGSPCEGVHTPNKPPHHPPPPPAPRIPRPWRATASTAWGATTPGLRR